MQRLSRASRRLIGIVSLMMIAMEVLLPLGIITTYCLIEGIWSLADLKTLGFYLACLPVLVGARVLLNARLNAPVTEGMEAAQAGLPLEGARLYKARKTALNAPRRAGWSVVLCWSLVHPSILAWGMWQFGEHRHAWPEMYLAGLLIAPLMGIICALTTEELMRPAIRSLFPNGGLSLYHVARSRTLAKRLMVVGMLWAYTLVVLIALTLRTFAAAESLADGMHRLIRLDAFFLFSSLGMLGTLAFLSRRMLGQPFETVLKALQEVDDGNLSVRLPLEIGDNLGILAERFNDMVDGLRERMHLQEAFGRYVSPEIARKAVTGPLSLDGETREITVLFADIRGFTSLSEQLDAEVLVAMMNRYFELLVTCVRAQGGHVNKFIGDGMMALFGAPETNPRHAECAVHAALAIEQALEIFNVQQQAHGLPELAIGIGIATGQVIIGNVGSRDRLEYTAMGDTVNVASRIEGLNKELNSTILVSEATYQRVKECFSFHEQGSLFVKGKRHAINVYSPRTLTDAMVVQPV